MTRRGVTCLRSTRCATRAVPAGVHRRAARQRGTRPRRGAVAYMVEIFVADHAVHRRLRPPRVVARARDSALSSPTVQAAAGSSSTNWMPRGSRSSARRSPAIARARWRAANRPIPAPRGESSSLTNGSKIRSRHSAGMPGPSSVIARYARPSSYASRRCRSCRPAARTWTRSRAGSRAAGGACSGEAERPQRPLEKVDRQAVPAEHRRQLAGRLLDHRREVERHQRAGSAGARAGSPGWSRPSGPADRPAPARSVSQCGASAARSPCTRAPPSSSTYARTTASGVRSAWVTTATRFARASSMARRLSSCASASRCSRCARRCLRAAPPASRGSRHRAA